MKTQEFVTLQHGGTEYTVLVEFDPKRAAEALLERAIRNRSRKSYTCGGAAQVRITAQVPLK